MTSPLNVENLAYENVHPIHHTLRIGSCERSHELTFSFFSIPLFSFFLLVIWALSVLLKRYGVPHRYPLPSLWRSSPGWLRNVPGLITAS